MNPTDRTLTDAERRDIQTAAHQIRVDVVNMVHAAAHPALTESRHMRLFSDRPWWNKKRKKKRSRR